MPKQIISLKSLIGALSRSFSTAQEELCWSQLGSLLEFFHKDGTPKNLKFTIPRDMPQDEDLISQEDGTATSSNTQSTYTQTYQAPILSLIAPSPLQIADGKMEFNVAITEMAYQRNDEISAKERFLDIGGHDGSSHSGDKDSLPIDLLVDTSVGDATQRGSLRINMRVKAAQHQDGYDRMLSKLSQLQGFWDQE